MGKGPTTLTSSRLRFEPAAFRLTADISYRLRNRAFASWLRVLFRHDWVVYAKRPFGGPEHALRYLGAYTHRVAISNSRRTPTERSLKCPHAKSTAADPRPCPSALRASWSWNRNRSNVTSLAKRVRNKYLSNLP
jgi:hypothetical protein